ncbi:MAG TPA: DUF4838 domain-containing protein [Verrucomicrobiota bacterium]|nr:DUF4838 domain-containing protein [Verrucomicrobiota bacterium]HNT15369.1 DUF4838 domain-containing protein [Verrucomicrobiota bacterium]
MNIIFKRSTAVRAQRRGPSAWRGCLLGLLCLTLAVPARAELTLADRGASKYRIVLPQHAIPAERYAAAELQQYLEKMCGAKLPVVSDAEKPAEYDILLGDNAHLGKARAQIDFARLGPDGFTLRADGQRLIIAGGRPRGTLNGVYTLLEDRLGVRWFTPELEVVPKSIRVRLPRLNETIIPALENRDVFWRQFMRNADFAARHRLNGQHYGLQEKHGGAFTVYHPFVHSFDALVPPDLYQEHPEYFPLIDGKRKGGYVQRCLSNPDVLRLTIARVRQWIREHPEATIISISQNDTFNNCQCALCKAVDDAEGSPAGSLLKFVNAVAEAIEKDHPNIRIDTLAYQYTRQAPRTIRPRQNVIVRLCSIECCFAHPLETCPAPENEKFRDDIVAWGAIAPLMYVWDYTTDFAHYLQPFPNFDCLQANVRFFVKHNVKGLFEQGNYSSGGGGEMEPLRAYLLAKLLWNPETDVQKHTREFLAAYYGAAAPKLQAYLDTIHRPVREAGRHIHIFDGAKSAYLAPELMDEAEQRLDEAEALADDEAVRFRVQVARLPVWYVKIATGRLAGPAKTDLAKRFVAIARKAGISNISEGQALNDWAKKLGVD